MAPSFELLFKPFKERPEWHFTKAIRTRSLHFVAAKDYFQLSTWLCIGGLLQTAAVAYFGFRATIPVIVLLVLRTIDHLSMALGITHNRYMDGAIRKKWGVQLPHADGTLSSKPADESVVVFFVGQQVNHPLGFMAPGLTENRYYQNQIAKALDDYYDKKGLLGWSQWQGTTEHANNMIMFIMYWKNIESLHNYAHGPEHMAGLRWWSQGAGKKYPHLSVFHETYIAPKGHFENIYLNCKPLGFGATTVPISKPSEDGKENKLEWLMPIVDSKRGPLRTFARRMLRDDLTAHEKEDNDIWDNTV
ncbi:uncharacterized protein F4807DRAFT_439329 [Annulohypoxylon truncatum]|uniref:uncharacterized protein n=1 Tax=Annulohypoxylon truncatum TaxID=327061 RepID=UPI00200820D8|nr:uncharacterized protein F4807DRAFT_439329 [Annulohypoxylon truncatum]KAI1206484.1 hypothetical protein F4807DRAFT_439329 [Annulohypoxylon truncatum]